MLHCHAGCEPAAVAAALGLSLAELMPPRTAMAGNVPPRIIASYDYRDESAERLFQVVRYEPKDFRQVASKLNCKAGEAR